MERKCDIVDHYDKAYFNLLTLSGQVRTSWPRDSDLERGWPVLLAEWPRSPTGIHSQMVAISRNYVDPEIHEKAGLIRS